MNYRLDIKINLHNELATKVRDIIQNFEPELANEPPMVFFQKFRNFDLDVKFKNTDDLPEGVKKNVN
jgi:hypothetical protein